MQAGRAPARVALVVGNADYRRAGRLKSCVADARAVAARLVQLGFFVRTELDLERDHFHRAVREFLAEIESTPADLAANGGARKFTTALVYFAGHALQVRGRNYLLPIDAEYATEAEVQHGAVELDAIIAGMRCSVETSLLLLDCCRDTPLARHLADDAGRSIGAADRGLAGRRAPPGTFMAFATLPDTIAEDGLTGLSPFTAALVRHMAQPAVPLDEIMGHVRRAVYASTGGRQVPWDDSGLSEPFTLWPAPGPAATPAQQSPEQAAALAEEAQRAREEQYWELLEGSRHVELLRSFALQFPASARRREAIARIDALSRRGWRRSQARWIGAGIAGLAALLAGGTAIETIRFSTAGGQLANAWLVGDDIALHAASSLEGCRMRCVINTGCTAFTWGPPEPSAASGSGRGAALGVCRLKAEAVYRLGPPPGIGEPPAYSEYLRRRGRLPPRELPAGWTAHLDQTLAGEPVPAEAVLGDSRFRAAGGSPLDTREAGATRYWSVPGAACHQRCEALGAACKGLSYDALAGRCQLFGSIAGLLRDAGGVPIRTRAVHSACNDTTVRDCEIGSR